MIILLIKYILYYYTYILQRGITTCCDWSFVLNSCYRFSCNCFKHRLCSVIMTSSLRCNWIGFDCYSTVMLMFQMLTRNEEQRWAQPIVLKHKNNRKFVLKSSFFLFGLFPSLSKNGWGLFFFPPKIQYV